MALLATTALDIDSLLEGDWPQFCSLLQASYPHKQFEPKQAVLDDQQLHKLLGQLTVNHSRSLQDLLHIPSGMQLSPLQYAMLRFVEQLFDNYLANSKLHQTIKQLLSNFRVETACLLLTEQLPWQADQPLAELLASNYFNSLGWQPELGRAADRFLGQLSPLLKSLATIPPSATHGSLLVFFSAQQHRISKLEQRLHDSEVGQQNARFASQQSADALNRFMTGKKLPTDITQFLQGPWRESMRLTLLNKGQQSDDWQRLLVLTETLIWSFQPFDVESAEHCTQVYNSIAELSDQLQKHTIGLHHSNQLESELNRVENQHLKILRKQPLQYADFELIDSTGPLLNANTTVSNSLLSQATSYEVGQWFIFQQNGQQTRAKLAVKLPQLQQLLFTNLAGVKTLQYSVEEFAYLLSAKKAVALKHQDPFRATAEKMLRALAERLHQQQQQATLEVEKQQRLQQQQAIEKKAAIEKALHEAREHIARQQAERFKAQQLENQQQQLDNQAKHEKQALDKLNKLSIGAIVLFYDEDREREPCKLVAIIQSNGEHIFVNRLGIKQYSLSREQLSDRLLNSTAKILDQGSNFDNTLERVVNNIRTRK
jgi:hypothetical protein